MPQSRREQEEAPPPPIPPDLDSPGEEMEAAPDFPEEENGDEVLEEDEAQKVHTEDTEETEEEVMVNGQGMVTHLEEVNDEAVIEDYVTPEKVENGLVLESCDVSGKSKEEVIQGDNSGAKICISNGIDTEVESVEETNGDVSQAIEEDDEDDWGTPAFAPASGVGVDEWGSFPEAGEQEREWGAFSEEVRTGEVEDEEDDDFGDFGEAEESPREEEGPGLSSRLEELRGRGLEGVLGLEEEREEDVEVEGGVLERLVDEDQEVWRRLEDPGKLRVSPGAELFEPHQLTALALSTNGKEAPHIT